MSLSTSKKIVRATLGQLVVEAKAMGIEPYRDGGMKTYMLQVDDDAGRIKIGKAKVENMETAITLRQLAEAAKLSGVKPRKDAKGNEYFTYQFDLDKGIVEVVTPDDEDVKQGKAISPRRGK